MDVLNKINEIRDITKKIETKEIENDAVKSLIALIYPDEEIIKAIEDEDLKNIYLKSLLKLASAMYNFACNKTIAQELLQTLLKITNDTSIKNNIYEQLLEIKKDENNLFNNPEYVKDFNEKVAKLWKDFDSDVVNEGFEGTIYHTDNGDVIRNVGMYPLTRRLERQLNELISEENVLLINGSKNYSLKVIIIKNIINCMDKAHIMWRIRDHRGFEKELFSKLKKIEINDKVLEGKINEKIYGIDFDTKGLINVVDKLKKRIFGK